MPLRWQGSQFSLNCCFSLQPEMISLQSLTGTCLNASHAGYCSWVCCTETCFFTGWASSRWPALWAVQMSSRWIWGGDLICVYPTSCRNPVVDSCFLALPVSFIEWKTPAPTHINFAAFSPPKKQGKESGLRRENKIPTWTAKGKRKLLTHKSYIKLFHMTSYTLSPSTSFFLKSTQICSFFSPYATKALPSFRLKH